MQTTLWVLERMQTPRRRPEEHLGVQGPEAGEMRVDGRPGGCPHPWLELGSSEAEWVVPSAQCPAVSSTFPSIVVTSSVFQLSWFVLTGETPERLSAVSAKASSQMCPERRQEARQSRASQVISASFWAYMKKDIKFHKRTFGECLEISLFTILSKACSLKYRLLRGPGGSP